MMIFSVILKVFGYFVLCYGVVWLFLRWKLRIYFERFKNVKTIPGLPLPIGHGYKLIGKTCQEIFDFFNESARQYSETLLVWAGPFPTIVVSSPNDISAVLTSPQGQQKHYGYRFLQNKTGLATAPSDQWRISRKLLNHTFSFKMLQSFIPIFNECSAKLVRNLRTKCNGDSFDCDDEMFLCSLSMACNTTLGVELHLQEYENYDLFQVIQEAAGLITKRGFTIWLYPDFIYNLTKNSKRLNEALNYLYRLTEDIVQRKKLEYQQMSADEKSAILDDDNIHKPKIFLTQILHMAKENNLNDLYIREQVDTIIFAGSETSAGTVANTLLALAMNDSIQERVYREIMEVTAGSDEINYEMMSKLVYTEMVIKETLRLFPVAPFLLRESMGDIKISNCTIPKGTQMVVTTFNLQRDETIWGPNSNEFNPDNFLPEKIAQRHPVTFIPFSYGPRNCIALKYSMMSMKVMLCHLLRNYKFTTKLKLNELKFRYHLTLKLINGHLISIAPRQND